MFKRIIIALAITLLSATLVKFTPPASPFTSYTIEDKTLVCDEEYEVIDFIIALQSIKPC